MNNFKRRGETITKTAAGTIVKNTLQVVGDRAMCSLNAAVSGETYELLNEGVFGYACEPNLTIALGKKLYYDSGNDRLTTTAASWKPAGWAAGDGASATSIDCSVGAW